MTTKSFLRKDRRKSAKPVAAPEPEPQEEAAPETEPEVVPVDDGLPSLGAISALLATNEGAYRTALHAYNCYHEGTYSLEKAKALIEESLALVAVPEDESPSASEGAEAELTVTLTDGAVDELTEAPVEDEAPQTEAPVDEAPAEPEAAPVPEEVAVP